MDLLAAYASDGETDEANSDIDASNTFSAPPPKRSRREKGVPEQHTKATATSLPSAEQLLADIGPSTGSSRSAVHTLNAQLPTALATTAAPAKAEAARTAQQQSAPISLSTGFQLPPEPPRIRIFPHVEGNFATVVYLTVDEPAQAQLQALATELLSTVARATAGAAPPSEAGSTASNRPDAIHLWPTFAWAPQAASAAPASVAAAPAGTLGQQDPQSDAADQQLPLHLSISRTVPIKRIQIDSLQAALSKQLKPFKSCRVQLQGLVCLVNDAATRSFVGIRVATGEKQVVRMVEAVNRAFIIHGLQPFYEEPLPHVSLAWTPGDQASRLQTWLDTFSHQPITLKVSQVVCQIGKRHTVVWQG